MSIFYGLSDNFDTFQLIVTCAIGFTFVGSIAPYPRWRHLFYVVAGMWILECFAAIYKKSEISFLLWDMMPMTISAIIGGIISYRFKDKNNCLNIKSVTIAGCVMLVAWLLIYLMAPHDEESDSFRGIFNFCSFVIIGFCSFLIQCGQMFKREK